MISDLKVAAYQIVEAHLSKDLVPKVQEWVDQGWEPFGPVTYGTFKRDETNVEVWAQTMVKFDR